MCLPYVYIMIISIIELRGYGLGHLGHLGHIKYKIRKKRILKMHRDAK